MARRKHGVVAIEITEASYKLVHSCTSIGRHFAMGAAVSKEIPIGTDREYICMGYALVVAIVPLGQVVNDYLYLLYR